MQLTQGPALLFLGSHRVFLRNEKIGRYEEQCKLQRYLLHAPVIVTVGATFLLQFVVDDSSSFQKGHEEEIIIELYQEALLSCLEPEKHVCWLYCIYVDCISFFKPMVHFNVLHISYFFYFFFIGQSRNN